MDLIRISLQPLLVPLNRFFHFLVFVFCQWNSFAYPLTGHPLRRSSFFNWLKNCITAVLLTRSIAHGH